MNIGLGLGLGMALQANQPAAPHISLGTPTDVGQNAQASGAGSTMGITPVGTVPAGALVVVTATSLSSANVSTVTDTKSNTYNGLYNSGGSSRTCIFYSILATSISAADKITITFSTATGEKVAVAGYITGVVATSSYDQIGKQTIGTSGAPSVTSGTLAQAAEVAFGYVFVTSGSGDSFTEAAGWTTLTPASLTNKLHVAAKVTAATTAVTYAPTLGASRSWTCNIVTFKENP